MGFWGWSEGGGVVEEGVKRVGDKARELCRFGK